MSGCVFSDKVDISLDMERPLIIVALFASFSNVISIALYALV